MTYYHPNSHPRVGPFITESTGAIYSDVLDPTDVEI